MELMNYEQTTPNKNAAILRYYPIPGQRRRRQSLRKEVKQEGKIEGKKKAKEATEDE